MNLITPIPYLEHVLEIPQKGKHILASYGEETIVVYQAYNQGIGSHAVEQQRFGGEFSMNRMTWIKPNFLWMMYRSGWGTKPNQEVILAIELKRTGFEHILQQAVHSSFQGNMTSLATWKKDLKNSEVRLQWDPDHDPYGNKQERRAIQLGIRGDILFHYVNDWIVEIVDISPFVSAQRENIRAHSLEALYVPAETVYTPLDLETLKRIGISEI